MSPEALAMGAGGEFDLLRRMLAVWGDRAVGIGDDVATMVVPPGEMLVASTDMSVEDVHFRRLWLSAREIGYRSTMAALSDLAAAAATPLGVLVALAIAPSDADEVEDLARGIGDAAAEVGVTIRGGDLTRGPRLTLAITVLGSVTRLVTRDRVKAGDQLYVTGVLGGPGAAVASWQRGERPSDWARQRFAAPRARIAEARWLEQAGVHAAIDISDGLASELDHLAAASGVELRVDVRRFPVGAGGGWRDAASSGEEYELLVAAPSEIDVNAFARAFGVPLTWIGAARAAAGPSVVARDGSERVDLPRGHDHFSR